MGRFRGLEPYSAKAFRLPIDFKDFIDFKVYRGTKPAFGKAGFCSP